MRLNLPRERFFLAPAAIWKRMVAFVIDFIIIDIVIFSPFQGILARLLPVGNIMEIQSSLASSPSLMNLVLGLLVIAGVLALLYFALLEYYLGTTVGKRLMHVYIASDKHLRFWQCIVRNAYFIPLFPLPVFWLIDPLAMRLSRDNSRFLERLSRTRTVERVVME